MPSLGLGLCPQPRKAQAFNTLADAVQLEDSDFLLLESGDNLLLETA